MRQRIGRRLISIMLSVLMMVSLLPTAVFAEELQNQTTAGVTEQVGEETGNTVEDSTENEDSIGTTVTTNEALAEAIAAAKDGDTITLGEGDFTTYGKTSPQKSLTFVGAGTGTVWTIGDLTKNVGGEGNGDYSFDGCDTITFRNMTLKSDGADYRGFIRISNTVVDNCTIDGKTAYWGYETAIFQNGTKFNAPEGDYALWDYSTKAMTFDNCTFNISGKGVHVYVEAGNAGSAVREVTVDDCTVNSTRENKAFLNIKNSTQAYDVTISGSNTVNGLSVNSTTNSALYQVEKTEITETSGKSVKVQEKAANGTLTTIYEIKAPVVDYIDLDTFIKWLESSSYSVDGANYTDNANAVVGGKLVVKWSPVSGCYDTREGHECTVGNVAATGNTPKRVNNGLTQFQLFEGKDIAVTVKNVQFVYEPADFTVCENSGWKGSFTVAQAPAGQLYFMTTGDVTFDSCEFDKVVLTSFNTTGSSTVTNCKFANVYNNYAIKDIRGANVSVTGTTITNCGGGIMVSSTGDVEKVTISGNTFKDVDVAGTAAEDKVGSRGLIQVANSGTYTNTNYDFSGNSATNCGPVLRQLNESVKLDKANTEKLKELGELYTSDSLQVASVGGVVYPTLKAAFAALSAENHTLTLIKADAWAESTPVYWVAGTQSGYVAKLTDALTAAYKANAGDITIVCRPGADVGTMTHGHVADNITIYGNDAYISGGECDLEVDTYKFSRATGAQANDGESLMKDITINAYELDNLGVWGQRNTSHTINVNLTDCDGKAFDGVKNPQRVYISNNSGVTSSVNNITLTGCNFLTANTAVYSNANGTIVVDGCSFTGSKAPVNINHDGDGAVTVEVKNSTFTNCGDKGEWKNFAAPIRFVNSGSGTMKTTVDSCTFEGTVGKNGDILIGDGRAGKVSNDLSLTVKNTHGWVQAQKPGRYDGNKVDTKKRVETEVDKDVGLTTSVKSAFIKDTTGTRNDPYTLEQLSEMTRAEYIAAQKRLGDTMYVAVGNYEYDTNGVLGNGVRNDTPGQKPDHSKLNSYAENGYVGDKNDGANGKNIVFVNGSITSNVDGYTSIDDIGTSLLLAVPAYTNVTFEGITFNNVMSFDYQLYTSPWSQLGELKFKNCVFEGIIVGAIAAQELTFDGCRFEDYENLKSENSSNPTWIRPAYGNWKKGDNEGQGNDFRSLTKITFTNNTVTSTRPVKFERIAQWEMATTVTATGNTFTINKVQSDTDTKNVGMYFGANAKFNLVVDNNTAKGKTAGLYTAVYSAPNGKSYAGLPAGSTVKNSTGETSVDALVWKSTKPLTLKTTEEVAQLTTTKGVVKFATLQEAINAAANGDTVTLLLDETVTTAINVTGKSITLDLNGKTLSSSKNGITVAADAGLTVKDSSENKTGKVVATGSYSNGIENAGTLTIESGSFEAVYGAVRALGGSTTTINGGTFSSSTGRLGMYYWANGKNVSVTVNGGTFKSSVSTAMENGKVTLKVNGGSFATDLSAYCPVDCGTFLSEESGLYEFGKDADHTPAGYEVDTNGNVTISTEDGLFWFARQVNLRGQTFKDKTVKLDNDITLTKAWEPVGVSVQKSFQGTFDGNGHSISGMKVAGGYQTTYGYGFFKLVISATVKNLTIENANVTGIYSNVVGIVTGYSYGSSTFENVHVKNSAVYAFGKVGGMVGMAEDAGATTTFRNCSVTGTTIHVGYNGAGFCGLLMGKCNITGSYLADNNVIIDEDSQGFGKVTELDTTVACDGSVATCAGNGTVIKGKYLPRSGYYWSAYSDLYNHYGAGSHDCTLADGKKLANSEVVHDAPVAIGDVKYSDLQAAANAAKSGDTITLLADVSNTDYTVANVINVALKSGVTFDGNQKTLSGNIKITAASEGGVTIKNVNFKDIHNNAVVSTAYKLKYGFSEDKVGTLSAIYVPDLTGSLTITDCNFENIDWEAMQITPVEGADITVRNNIFTNSESTTVKEQLRHVHVEMAYGGGVDHEGEDIKLTATDNQFLSNTKEANMGIWWVGKGSELNLTGNYYKDPSAVSITLSDKQFNRENRCELIFPARSQATVDVDDLSYAAMVVKDAFNSKFYTSLTSAIEAAASGETVKLLADVTIEGEKGIKAQVATGVTFDLNGYSINGSNVSLNSAVPAALVLTVGYNRSNWLGSFKITNSGNAEAAIRAQLPLQFNCSGYADGVKIDIDSSVKLDVLSGGTNAVYLSNSPLYLPATDTTRAFYKNGGFLASATDGDRIYESLGAAKTANKTVTLLNDYKTSVSPSIWGNWGEVTLDLNNKTYEYTGKGNMFELRADANVTFKNGTLKAEKAKTVIGSPYDNTTLTLDNVTVEAGGDYGIATNGNNVNNIVVLTNSTINAANVGIYFPSSGTLTIVDSEITAKTLGVQVCAGSLIVSGERTKITVTGDAVLKTENDGAIEDGAAISIVNRTGYKGLETVEINEGTFVAKAGNQAIKAYNWANKSESDFTQGEKVTIAEEKVLSSSADTGVAPTAGTAWVLVPGEKVLYAIRKIGDCEAEINGTYYLKLQDAIGAAQNGATVVLVKDVDTPEVTYVIDKSLTIDLSGMTVTGSGYDGVFQITGEGAKVLIKNGDVVAVEQKGSAGKYAMAVWACAADCEVTLEDLDVSQKITSVNDPQMDMIYTSAGTIIINSGSFESGTPKWTLNCNDDAYKADKANIIVNGGTFVNFDPMNNRAEGVGTSFVAAGVGVDYVDGKFTAKSGMIAQVVDADGKSVKAYNKSLSAALADAKDGQIVKLLNNVDNETFVMVKAGVTLDLAGKNITGATMLYVTGTIVDTAASATKGAVSAEAYMIASSVGSGYTPIYSGTGYQFYKLGMNITTKDVSADGATVIFAPKTKNEWTAELNAFRTLLAPGFDTSKVQIVLEVEWGETNTHDSQRFAFNDQYVYKYATEDSWAFSVTMNGLNALSGKVTATAKIITYGADGREMTWLSSDAVPLKGE